MRAATIDLLDPQSALRVLNEYGIERVFHLAAQTIVATANSSPVETLETNVRGTYNLLDACRALSVSGLTPRVVVASSYHAYGRGDGGALSESSPLRSTYPYDVSKACADFLARSYAATYGLPIGIARLANVYGGGDLNWSRIVPGSVSSLLKGQRPVIASDGTPERDYVYVEDAVDAYLAISESLLKPEHCGRAWNGGSGRSVSVLELVKTLIESAGLDLEPEVKGTAVPRAEIDRQYLDSSAIHDQLGWSANWSLRDGLAATYAWYEASFAA